MSDQKDKNLLKRLKRNFDKNRILSEDNPVKKSKIKENSLMYGIGYYNFTEIPKTLIEKFNELTEDYFFPKLNQGHRGVAIFLFESEEERSDKFIQDSLGMNSKSMNLQFSIDPNANF